MSTRLPFVPVFVYVILLVKCNGNFHYKEGIEETPCNRQTGVALTQVRLGPSQFEEAEIGVQHPATASFKGLALPTSDSYRNDVELQCRMAMRHMSQDALPSSLVLRHMRPELGDMCNADFKPAWTEYEQEAVDEFLGRSVRANETKEPTAENKTEIEEETTCMAPRRTAIESECADMATSSQLAADANGFGYQRRRQRIPYADEPCATASTAPADVAWTDAPIRATMDAKSSGGDATDVCDACDDSFTGDHLHWTASYACDAQSGDARGTADRDEGAAEAEQNSQGCQEREHLSPEFQSLVHQEIKKDNKECSRNLHTAVTALDKAKEAQLEIENARMQLWSQWRVFLQQSVIKWKEYTAQFQAAETAFQAQAQEALLHVKRAQRRMDIAKKHMDANDQEETYTVSSDEDVEEMDSKDDVEVVKDENAQKIQEGLKQVVSSLEVLSESAEKLEPKAKRPRKDDDQGDGDRSSPNLQPFARAGAA